MDDVEKTLLNRPENAITEKGEPLFPSKSEYIRKLAEGDLNEHMVTYEKVCEISEVVKEAGGRALLVGGSVRDTFFGKTSKDYDLEVYGIEASQLKSLIEQFGHLKEVGETFGILNLTLINGMTIDISLPRTDSKILESDDEHGGFDIKADPKMSIKEAARRRDFTMNSLAADPLTGELFDHYGGLDDIRTKTLRATDPTLFADDSLRVLRGLQFVSRFGLSVEKETGEVMSGLAPRIEKLPRSRISEEWRKLLTKGNHPSLGLEVGMKLGIWDQLYPELAALDKTPQDRVWHPEGNVGIHTRLVVDQASLICKKLGLDGEQSFILMLSALCHDFGKPATTKREDDGTITSYGHEQKGREPAIRFLDKITDETRVKEMVLKLVVNHMSPGTLYRTFKAGRKVSDGSIERLARRLFPATIAELVQLCEADSKGRGFPEIKVPDIYQPGAWLTSKAEELGVYKEKPKNLFTGKDLLALGFKQGKPIGEMIELGRRLRGFENMLREIGADAPKDPYTKEEALALIAGIERPEAAIDILKKRAIAVLQKIRKLKQTERAKEIV